MSVSNESEEEAVSSYMAFLRECWMMKLMEHSKVIRLVGLCFGPLAMILDYCSQKDLRSFLDSFENISWEIRLKIALDVVHGLNVAHQSVPVILHRDLKSPNVFIHMDESVGIEARVADLGLSTFFGGTCRSEAVDNPAWSAPEVIARDPISEKADIFSIGIIMWELMTGRFPYNDLMAEYGFASKLSDAIVSWKVRPTFTGDDVRDVPAGFVSLMQRCWSDEPAKRPSCSMLLHSLAEMNALLPSVRSHTGALALEMFGEVRVTGDSINEAGMGYSCICRSGQYLFSFCLTAMSFGVIQASTGQVLAQHLCSEAVSGASSLTMVAMSGDRCWVLGKRWKCVLEVSKDAIKSYPLRLMKFAQAIVSNGENSAWVFGMANQAKKNVVAVRLDGKTGQEIDGSQVYFNIASLFKADMSPDGLRVYALVYEEVTGWFFEIFCDLMEKFFGREWKSRRPK